MLDRPNLYHHTKQRPHEAYFFENGCVKKMVRPLLTELRFSMLRKRMKNDRESKMPKQRMSRAMEKRSLRMLDPCKYKSKYNLFFREAQYPGQRFQGVGPLIVCQVAIDQDLFPFSFFFIFFYWISSKLTKGDKRELYAYSIPCFRTVPRRASLSFLFSLHVNLLLFLDASGQQNLFISFPSVQIKYQRSASNLSILEP